MMLLRICPRSLSKSMMRSKSPRVTSTRRLFGILRTREVFLRIAVGNAGQYSKGVHAGRSLLEPCTSLKRCGENAAAGPGAFAGGRPRSLDAQSIRPGAEGGVQLGGQEGVSVAVADFKRFRVEADENREAPSTARARRARSERKAEEARPGRSMASPPRHAPRCARSIC